jgi:hypothetical protein
MHTAAAGGQHGPHGQGSEGAAPARSRPDQGDDEFEFVSSVDAVAAKDVESLFYFHPRQHALLGSIRSSVEAFGQPQILRRGERIALGIPKRETQCLFACHPSRRPGVPVGVVVYLRTEAELLNILHVAVGPAYEASGPYGDRDLTMRLVAQVRAVARRISGVRRIALPYGGGRCLSVPRGAAAH